MANHCFSTLIVAAPASALSGILSAMEGPCDWFFPESLVRGPAQTLAIVRDGRDEDDVLFDDESPASAHALLSFEAELSSTCPNMTAEAWRAERARRFGHPIPAWMPLTSGCIARMAFDPHWPEAVPTAPLSMPRLFETLGLNEGAFVAVVGDLSRYEQAWANDVRRGCVHIPVREHLVETKWGVMNPTREPPQDLLLGEDTWSFSVLRYTTAWGPLANLDSALSPLLEREGGRAILVWHEEGGHQGFEAFCPDEGFSVYSNLSVTPPSDDAGGAAWEAYFTAKPRAVFAQARQHITDDVLAAAMDALLAKHDPSFPG